MAIQITEKDVVRFVDDSILYTYNNTVSPSTGWSWKPDPRYCKHQFIDTGMRRTYCKICDVRADRDLFTGEITILPDVDTDGKEKEKAPETDTHQYDSPFGGIPFI